MDWDVLELLKKVVDSKGSDLHITVGLPPVIRIDGRLTKTDLPVLKPEDTEYIARFIVG